MTEEVKTTIEETVDPVLFVAPSDADASWNGKGSLDEHRQKEFQKMKQPGFGDAGKAKINGE